MVMDDGQNNKAYLELWTWKRNKICKIIKTCAKLAIENLTLYAFQQETGTDPRSGYFNENPDKIIKKELNTSGKQHQIKHDGNLENYLSLLKRLLDVINKTKDNTQMTLTLALSSREEIVNAVKTFVIKLKIIQFQ
jgi:undecaprenyl diphosphate synthase